MKNLNILPIDSKKKQRIEDFAKQYKRFAKVYVDIEKVEGKSIFVRVEQKEPVNGKALNPKQLTERVKEMFKGELPLDYTLHVAPVFFNREDINHVNPQWINDKIGQNGIRLRHLRTYTGVDISTLSSLVNGEKPLTKWHKVALYYFFKFYEFDVKTQHYEVLETI